MKEWSDCIYTQCAECIYKVVQQRNLGDVVNSIQHLCTDT